jgi:signal transduction histidine kinase/CheY-like chemotaxis protein
LTNAALESAADGILLVDRNGNITRWNQKFVDLWHVPEQLLTVPFADAPVLGHAAAQLADPEAFLAKVMALYAHPEASSSDLLTFVDGRVVERYSQPQKVGDEIVGRFWSFRDITERIRAEAARQDTEKQLLHTQKLESLGVLAGGIAHDFNNILTVIIGNAELALMRINKESPATENLQRIEQAAARAADLARQMLAYSGKGKFVVENIDLNILLAEMLHMLEVSISKKAVLRLNPYRPLPTVEADATQLRQIIMNMVINASEAIGDKSGVIAITTGCMHCDQRYLKDVWLNENLTEGLYVYLEIADTGCGMDRETLSKLFDPFFTTKFTGRGLGMAAVLGIVRGHKGAINIYSEVGKGTTFKILLPASGRPADLFNGDSRKDDWRGTGTVLLVDDEETIRGIGAEMLKLLGFAVITANDGREALELFQKTDDIALAILDLTMPRMDGEQCFRELRQLRPDVKVIISSGYNEQEVTQRFVGKGLAGFIQKPYKLSALKEILRKVLA